MGPEWVAGGQTRVHEIIGWIMPHFEALHESPRPRVVACGEGNDLPQGKNIESETERLACSFCRVALSPMLAQEAPTDLDAGCEVRVEVRYRQTNEAEKRRVSTFDGPKPEPTGFDLLIQAFEKSIAFSATKRSREELHHIGVRIENGKWFAI
jgi:hypothetical protein